VQVHVPGAKLGEGADDTDHRPAELFLGHSVGTPGLRAPAMCRPWVVVSLLSGSAMLITSNENGMPGKER
jgi:hypothetical protein